MPCCHADFAAVDGGDRGFTVGMPTFTFGADVLSEAGDSARELGLSRVALFTDARMKSSEFVATVKALARSREGRCRDLRRGHRRAHRRVVPGCGAIRGRRQVRRLRLGRRRLGDGHVQGGEPLRHASRRVHDLRERADRRRAARSRAREAAHRMPDYLGHRVRDDRHRDLQPALAERQDRDHLAAPDSGHRADRSGRHCDAAAERDRRDRLRLHEPRARIADRAGVSAAAQSGEGRPPAGIAGREPVLRHARGRSVAWRRQVPRARGKRRRRRRSAHRDDVCGDARRHRVQRRRLPPAARTVVCRIRIDEGLVRRRLPQRQIARSARDGGRAQQPLGVALHRRVLPRTTPARCALPGRGREAMQRPSTPAKCSPGA